MSSMRANLAASGYRGNLSGQARAHARSCFHYDSLSFFLHEERTTLGPDACNLVTSSDLLYSLMNVTCLRAPKRNYFFSNPNFVKSCEIRLEKYMQRDVRYFMSFLPFDLRNYQIAKNRSTAPSDLFGWENLLLLLLSTLFWIGLFISYL